MNANNVQPVGMILGAHVVGHLGHCLNGSLARITGLDPAGYTSHITIHNLQQCKKLDLIALKYITVCSHTFRMKNRALKTQQK